MDYSKVVKLFNELASVGGVNVEYHWIVDGEIRTGDKTPKQNEISDHTKLGYFHVRVSADCDLCRLEMENKHDRSGFRLDITDEEVITEGYYDDLRLIEARDRCVSIMRKFVMENIGGIVYKDILTDPKVKATHICDVQRKLDDELFEITRDGEKVECCFSDLTESEMEEALKWYDDFNVRELCISLGQKIREIGDLLGITREDLEVGNENK